MSSSTTNEPFVLNNRLLENAPMHLSEQQIDWDAPTVRMDAAAMAGKASPEPREVVQKELGVLIRGGPLSDTRHR